MCKILREKDIYGCSNFIAVRTFIDIQLNGLNAGRENVAHYAYREFLQVAAFDVSGTSENLNYTLKRVIYWDPTAPTATRPLALNVIKNGAGTLSAPENPFRFSSEFYDSELDLVYYNFRHYSPALGRFLSRDPIEERGGLNLYAAYYNSPIVFF